MITLSAADVARHLPYPTLIEALRNIFREQTAMPQRLHYDVAVPRRAAATLLLMPAWQIGRYIGVKLASVFPDNQLQGLPSVQAIYLLADANDGRWLAQIDGAELTLRRTAAASALAADYLAREDARHLCMMGTGRLAPYLVAAHAAIRPLQQITIWGRDAAKAAASVRQCQAMGLPAQVAGDAKQAVGAADIISCATLAQQPILAGDWLQPGSHVDLVGGFRPTMREADDAAIRRCNLYVDTRDGALHEAGDLTQPLAAGLIDATSVRADLYELCRGEKPGRLQPDTVTLFKSVGAAIEDLAAAIAAYEAHQAA